MTAGRRRLPQEISSNILGTTKVQAAINQQSTVDVTKHRTVRTGAKYRSWILVKCVWCGAYYWFRLRKGTGYSFHAFLTCILLLLLLIQCKIPLYLGPVRTVRPVRCFVTPINHESMQSYNECSSSILMYLTLRRATSHVSSVAAGQCHRTLKTATAHYTVIVLCRLVAVIDVLRHLCGQVDWQLMELNYTVKIPTILLEIVSCSILRSSDGLLIKCSG